MGYGLGVRPSVGLGQPMARLGLWARGDMTHLEHVTVQGPILGLFKVRVSKTD